MKKYHYLRVVLSLIIVFSMLVYLVPATVSAAGSGTAPEEGTGTVDDPYQIDEPLELVWMGENYDTIRSSYFIQTADIDMFSVGIFTSIGNGTALSSDVDSFAGVYNGLGFKITSLKIDSNLVYAGLFQSVSGTVKNVNLVQANITNKCSGYDYPFTGGIAGRLYVDGTIKNCSVSGTISQTGTSFGGMTGGITGENYGTVYDCFCSAAVSAASAKGQAGGITGYTPADYVSVSRCGFSGSVSGAVEIIGCIVGNYFRGIVANNVFYDDPEKDIFGRGSINDNFGCTPASIDQMKLQTTYTGESWNFDSVWMMDPVSGFPTFILDLGVPLNVSAVSGENQITVEWDAVEYASGYNVYYGTSAGVYSTPVTTPGTSTVISGLTNMTTYYIAVKALRVSTEGAASAEKTCTPHVMINDLTAAGSISSANISFTAPTGASAVVLQQSTDGGANYTDVGVSLTSSSTGTVLTGLSAATYLYRLRLTFAGTTSYSNTASATVGGTYTKVASASVNNVDYMWDFLYIGCYENVIDDAALKFDLSDCAGSVKNAFLYIYVSEYPEWSYGNAVFDLYGHSDDDWTDSLPAYPSVPTNSTLIQSGITDLAYGEYKQMTVTDFVKGQIASGDKIISFYLAGQLTSDMALDDVCVGSAANPTYKPYIVIEFANDNANLSGIKVGGTDLPGFTAGTTSYNYTAPHDSDLSALSLTSTLADTSASQSPWTYNTTNQTWSVTVTAPDGSTTKTYSVAVTAAAQSSDATLTSISIDGTPLVGFSSSVLDYSYSVAHTTSPESLLLSSAVKDHMAVQDGWTYSPTDHKWSNTVTAEDGTTKTYTVTINVLPDTDATLKSIKVGGTGVSGFSPATLDYTCNVVHGTVITAGSFVSETTDVNAEQGTWTYNATDDEWSVLVTAEDGTTQITYTVTIHELPDTDATLKSIKIGGTDVSGFSPSTVSYTYNVAHGSNGSALVITSETTDVNAEQGTWTYNATDDEWSVLVTAEDGTTKLTYTVAMIELPDSDATLKSIKIDGTDLSGFSASTFAYTYDVAHGSNGSALVFVSETTDVNAEQGTWTYNATDDEWSVLVTAEDGTTKTYTVTINVLPDTDATLKSIKVGGTGVSGFSPATLEYTCKVVHGTVITAGSFVSETTDVNAEQGTWTYNATDDEWSVLVTAEDGTTQITYTVTVIILPDTDATLKSIKIGGTDVSGFSPSTVSYTYNVAHGSNGSALVITSETTDVNAEQGTWTYNATDDEWSVLVTAEDGTTKLTYTVAMIELPDSDATLKSIKVGGTDISGFSSLTYAYSLDVAHGTVITSLSFVSETTDSNAVQGTWTYNATDDEWSVLVTAEDGTTQITYTVTIHELLDTDATLKSIQVNGTGVSGFLPTTLDYTCNVAHGTIITDASFVSETTDVNAEQGTWTYNATDDEWSVQVTAEDGTTKITYTVTILILPDNDATLKNIQIDGTDIIGFSPKTTAYTYDVAHGSNGSALVLTSEAADINAVQGTWTYDATNDEWSVLVTAEDGTTQTVYTVTMNELPDTDATLKSIKVGGLNISGFSSTTFAYTFDVAHGTVITSLSFVSETTDINAGQSTWTYDATEDKWSVLVTAQDGTTQLTYTVTINELPSTDATLKSIKVGGTDLSGFSPLILDYTYTTPFGTDPATMVFTSICNDSGAVQSAWIYNAVNGKWSVTVTAQDTTTKKTYSVAVVEDKDHGDYKTNTLLYQSHVQDIGWQEAVLNGNISGTTGQSKRLEAISIKLQDISGGIEYCTHLQDKGWVDWSSDGSISGTTGQSRRLEAIKIRLTGEAADKYDIYYRVHVQDIGWMDWAKNGESAGSAACSYRMEAIQIVMVLKGDAAPGPTDKAFYNGHTNRYNEQ